MLTNIATFFVNSIVCKAKNNVLSSLVASAIIQTKSGSSSVMNFRVTISSSDRADNEYVPGKSISEKNSSDKMKCPSFFSIVFPGQLPTC
jgi:hypothetical protein